MRNQLLADACFSLVSANELMRSGASSASSSLQQQPESDTHGNFESENDRALEQGLGKEGRR